MNSNNESESKWKICPECNRKVNKVAKTCPYCDYDFINKMYPTSNLEFDDTPIISKSIDIDNILNADFEIKESSFWVFDMEKERIRALCNMGSFLASDAFKNEIKKYCPLIHYLNTNSDNTITGIFLDDLFKYLGYLAFVDDRLESGEINLINYIFNAHWTRNDVHQILDPVLENYPPKTVPLTLMILHEYDLLIETLGVEPRTIKDGLNLVREYDSVMLADGKKPTAVEMYFNLYDELGYYIISTDGDRDDKESRAQLDHTLKLRRDYDAFRGSGYEKIIRSLSHTIVELPDDVNPMQKIKQAKELLDLGAISQEEFDEIKTKYMKFI